MGPGNLATGLGQALPLIISTPCLSCVLASTQHSNRQPGAAHISPTLTHFQPATSNGSFRSRLDRTLRCPIVRPHPLSQPFFSPPSFPAPSSGLQLSPKACLQVRKTGTALPDASLDSAAAHPPDAQSRHKFIRCHRSDYRKYGGILRYESCGSGCLCSRVEVEAVPVLVVTEHGVL